MRLLFFLLGFFIFFQTQAQIVGKVTDANGQALPFVNIYLNDSNTGTTSNNDGNYKLDISKIGNYKITFQYLGFQTKTKSVVVNKLPFILNATLNEQTTSLDEVVVNSSENPANAIIRAAIVNRKTNLAKVESFTADFYSRGLWRVEDAPKRILGQDIGDFNGALDSTRQGVIYLSETISEIKYEAPDNFKENIIASIVSGDDNGFSLNTAQESNITFYENTVDLNTPVISPIADNAFNYYKYRLEGVFYDDLGNLINKIEVIPRRENDPVFSGHIFIVDERFEVYGTALNITGNAIKVPPVETLTFIQNYKYSKEDDAFIRTSQIVDFEFSFLGFEGNGRFTAVYSNYNFSPQFDKTTFGAEILSFEENANEKDSLYWKGVRPIPLTNEELTDYIRKDSIQAVRGSKSYLDSIDAVENTVKFGNLIGGYTFKNSYKDYSLEVTSPLTNLHYNTVKGWNSTINVTFQKNQQEFDQNYWRLYTSTNYGFSDERLRMKIGYQQKFNNTSKPILKLETGVETPQINQTKPILQIINDITSLNFEENFLKIYERQFAEVNYSQELFNGLRVFAGLSFEKRKPLFNTTDQTFFPREDKRYTSNNPLLPTVEGVAPFEEHNIIKANLNTQIVFGQEYYSYPDGKFNVSPDKYPILVLGYEGGYVATIEDYNFHQLKARVYQNFDISNKGRFGYNVRGGLFLESAAISLVDFQHFNGNETNIGTSATYLDAFNLLPYYAFSTNNNYLEAHIEHDFKGYILNKIPLVNKLGFNLVFGGHVLTTKQNKPYYEYSVGLDNVGFGKFRFFRIDYVRNSFNSHQDEGIIFGFKFLNILGLN